MIAKFALAIGERLNQARMSMASDTDHIHLLTVCPAREAAEQGLLLDLRAWFASAHGAPTEVQRHAWPVICQRQHVLLCSPTGSGKTLAAFLPILSQLLGEGP